MLGPRFASDLVRALPRMLAEGALPDDWDHRATTYDLMRFDSAEGFAQRFELALADILRRAEKRGKKLPAMLEAALRSRVDM